MFGSYLDSDFRIAERRPRDTRAQHLEVCQTLEQPWLTAKPGLLLAPNSPLTNWMARGSARFSKIFEVRWRLSTEVIAQLRQMIHASAGRGVKRSW